MRSPALLLGLAVLIAPALSFAQSGPELTQTRDGLGNASHAANTTNSLPAGSENASTGPQAHPAYPSGSSTANPGAGLVNTQPKPAIGTLGSPPGIISTTTNHGGKTEMQPAAVAVGQEGAGKTTAGK